MLHPRSGIAPVCLCLIALCLPGTTAAGAERSTVKGNPAASRSNTEARTLAATIDRFLAAKWAEAKIQPAVPADDAEFLRRVSLDLTGKIATVAEVRAFLDDPQPDKRERLVGRLLESASYLVHSTEIWRSLLLPEADTDAPGPLLCSHLRRLAAQASGRGRWLRQDRPRDPHDEARGARPARGQPV